jgi:hypothetical protein
MSDFNGRIGAILRATRKDKDDPGEARYAIREILRAENADGWKTGYSDGCDDRAATEAHKLKAAVTAAEYAWGGKDGRGEDSAGGWRLTEAEVAAVVEDRFETGWRSLVVTLDGEEVAGIGPHPEKPGEVQWWAAKS